METKVKDGTGDGNLQKVNANNRAYTNSAVRKLSEVAADNGESYHIMTGLVTLTNANESGMLYFKNNRELTFRITEFFFGFGASTGGASTSSAVGKVYRNPSTGTLISVAKEAEIRCNRNFSSSKLIQNTADVYEGIQGSTITNGALHFLVYPDLPKVSIDDIIPQGGSLALSMKPPTGNTASICFAGISGYYEDPNE